MAAPSDYPEWASSPSDPGDIVEPSSGVKADGFNPSERPPAQWFNWFFNLVYLWIKWLNEELLESGTRVLYMSPWTGYGVNSTGADPAFKSQAFSTGLTEGTNLASNINYAQWVLPVSDLVPDGVEVLAVTALVKPGAARAGTPGAEKMTITDHLHIVSFSGATSSFVSPSSDEVDDGTTNIQELVHPMGLTVNRSASQILIKLTCGFDAYSNPDRILGWKIDYTGRKWK